MERYDILKAVNIQVFFWIFWIVTSVSYRNTTWRRNPQKLHLNSLFFCSVLHCAPSVRRLKWVTKPRYHVESCIGKQKLNQWTWIVTLILFWWSGTQMSTAVHVHSPGCCHTVATSKRTHPSNFLGRTKPRSRRTCTIKLPAATCASVIPKCIPQSCWLNVHSF